MSKSSKKPVFDTKKNYRWEPEDILQIKGKDFASLYHTLTQEMNNVGGSTVVMKLEAYTAIMETLKSNVELGIVEEQDLEDVDETKIKQLFDK